MLTIANKLFALLGLAVLLTLTGCGATDSGHADSLSATTTSIGAPSDGNSDSEVAPSILVAPQSLALYEGESFSLQVTASGDNLIFLWQKEHDNVWLDLQEGSDSTYQVNYPTMADSGRYRVAVSNSAGTQFSQDVEVLVKENLFIKTHPGSQQGVLNSQVELSVVVEGHGPYQYQWYQGNSALTDNLHISGANDSQLTINGIGSSDQSYYRVEVSNEDGKRIMSEPALLKVIYPAAIAKHPSNAQVAVAGDTSLSVTASGSGPFSYQWQMYNGSSWQTIANANSSSLTLKNVTTAAQGQYRVVVDNTAGIPVASSPATITVLSPVNITQQPYNIYGKNHQVIRGDSLSMQVAAEGSNLDYEWYKGTKKISTGAKLNLGNLSESDAGTYQCRVSNSLGVSNCQPVTLEVQTPVSITTQPQSQPLVAGESGALSISLSGTAPFSYQWQKLNGSNWSNVAGGTGATLSFGKVSNEHAGSYRCIVNNVAAQPQTSQTASVTVTEVATILQQPSDKFASNELRVVGDSITFSVTGSGTALEYSWYKNNKLVSQSQQLNLANLSLTDAGTYQCQVKNSEASVDCDPITLRVAELPDINSQPRGATVYEGGNATLSIAASGTPTPVIEWFKVGQEEPVGSGVSLSFSGISLNDAGNYTCIVSNEAGSVSCNSVTVDVKEIVRISKSPSHQVVTQGNNFSLSVNASGEPPLTYQWYKGNSVIKAGTNLSTISLAANDSSVGGSYHVVVSNPGSEATSESANISIFVPEVLGTAHLSWQRPTQRANGTPLADDEISGYKVYHAEVASESALSEVAELSGVDNTTVSIDDLPLGTHYFALTTIDTNNVESDYSNIVSLEVTE